MDGTAVINLAVNTDDSLNPLLAAVVGDEMPSLSSRQPRSQHYTDHTTSTFSPLLLMVPRRAAVNLAVNTD